MYNKIKYIINTGNHPMINNLFVNIISNICIYYIYSDEDLIYSSLQNERKCSIPLYSIL